MRRFIIKLSIFCGLFLAIDSMCALLIKHGIDRYYGFNRDAKILVVGHSRTVFGIDGLLLENKTKQSVAKYAIQGTTLIDHLMMFKHYISEHPNSVKTAVYVVDDYMFGKGLGTNQYRLFYPYIDNQVVDSYIRQSVPTFTDYLSHKVLKLYRYSETTVQNTARMGYRGKTELSPDTKTDVNVLKKKIASANMNDQRKVISENIEQFNKILRFLRDSNIKVVLFYMPFIDLLAKDNLENHKNSVEIFRALARKDDGILFVDACADYAVRHDLFVDATHPNRTGQILFTSELAKSIVVLPVEGSMNNVNSAAQND